MARSNENDTCRLGLFYKIHYRRICCFLFPCLVSGVHASGFVESGPCQALEEAQKVAADHFLCSLGPHNYCIHRCIFDSTVKLTQHPRSKESENRVPRYNSEALLIRVTMGIPARGSLHDQDVANEINPLRRENSHRL